MIVHLLAGPEHFAVVLLAVLLGLAFLHWAFVPRRHVPWFRPPPVQSPLTLTICRSVCRTSTRSAASAMTRSMSL